MLANPTAIVIEYRRPGYTANRFALRFQPCDWKCATAEVCHLYAQGVIGYRNAQEIQRAITTAVLALRRRVRT